MADRRLGLPARCPRLMHVSPPSKTRATAPQRRGIASGPALDVQSSAARNPLAPTARPCHSSNLLPVGSLVVGRFHGDQYIQPSPSIPPSRWRSGQVSERAIKGRASVDNEQYPEHSPPCNFCVYIFRY